MNTQENIDYTKYFEYKTRTKGAEFYCLSDKSSSDLKDLVREIHESFDCLSNDWIYRCIHYAFYDLRRYNLDDIDIQSDFASHDLKEWFKEPFADSCVQEYEEMETVTKGMYNLLAGGQWLAKDRIYRMVNEFLEENI